MIGDNRFYVMSLRNFNDKYYYWYKTAFTEGMEDSAEYTSVDFGKGKENTIKMINKWNVSGYGLQTTTGNYIDIWSEIKQENEKGWFIPSRDEWTAFANELDITSTNFINKNLNDWYFSSSQYNGGNAWRIVIDRTYLTSGNVNIHGLFRIAVTF